MKNKLLTTFLTLTFAGELFAQTQLVKQWDYRYGGNHYDDLTAILKTNDGGVILAGSSLSGISGDKTVPNWDSSTLNPTYDFWLVKIDSLGIKQWDKKYGGLNDDNLDAIIPTRDGGYIMAGESYSEIGGDKTQPKWGTVGLDWWIIKIDSNFDKQWDKRFGGIGYDRPHSIQETFNGDFILGGTVGGDSGDVTQNTWGGQDYWLIRIDSAGNKLWDKRFGGSTNDFLESVIQTSDSGFLLVGMASSPMDGDITEPSFNTTLNTTTYDGWVVKTDANGNKQWDKRYGGNQSEQFYQCLKKKSYYYLYGYSASDSSGNKTTAKCDTAKLSADLWFLKIDLNGNIIWQRDYGGISHEESYSLEETSDDGFLLGATSYSPITCNKSEANLGYEQTWIIKTDANGIQQWDKTVLTTGHDELGLATQTADGCFLIANFTHAGIGGDKTQATQGITDYWIAKFCDTTTVVSINSIHTATTVFISPNPFSTDLSITIQKQNIKQATFAIHNVVGQMVFSQQENILSSVYTKTIDLSFLSNGIYFLQIVVDGERTIKKIIKQ